MNELQNRLRIPTGRLDALNGLLVDPEAPVIKEFLSIVAAYGTPEEINAKAAAARKPEALLKKVEA